VPFECAINMRMVKEQRKTPYKAALEALDKSLIQAALKAAGNNKSQVARELGVTRVTLYSRMKAYGL
jgi:transcriptional regulator with PAS, ATPase and Fis domain